MRRCMGMTRREIEKLTGVSQDSVRRRVLAEVEIQGRKKCYRKFIWRKNCIRLVVIVLLLICIGTAVFAVGIDFRKNYFGEGSDRINSNSALKSLENGDIRYTVEDTISDGDTLIIVYSVEGLSDEGKARVRSGDFLFGKASIGRTGKEGPIHLSFEADEKEQKEQIGFDSIIITPASQNSTENHPFYQVLMEFTGNCKVKTWLDGCDEVLEIPINLNPESIEIDLTEDLSDDGTEYNKIGEDEEGRWKMKKVRITKVKMSMQVSVSREYELPRIDFFAEHIALVYRDGTVKSAADFLNDGTYSCRICDDGVFDLSCEESEEPEEYDYILKGHFWDIPDIDQIESIMVDGVEFPADLQGV